MGTARLPVINVGMLRGGTVAVSLGIPAIGTGTLIAGNDHQLDEYAEGSSIVPGIKQLISLAVASTTH